MVKRLLFVKNVQILKKENFVLKIVQPLDFLLIGPNQRVILALIANVKIVQETLPIYVIVAKKVFISMMKNAGKHVQMDIIIHGIGVMNVMDNVKRVVLGQVVVLALIKIFICNTHKVYGMVNKEIV